MVASRPVSRFLRRLIRDRAVIFMFHRFLDPESGISGHNPILLRRAIAEFRRQGFQLLPLMELLERTRTGESSAGMIAFTVDDGYGDFYRVGGPMFESMDCPVTVFLATGFLDEPRWLWWDRLRYLMEQRPEGQLEIDLHGVQIMGAWSDPTTRRSLRHRIVSELVGKLPERQDEILQIVEKELAVEVPEVPPERFLPMTWDQVREVARYGVTFGPHTVSHRSFGILTEVEARKEISASWNRVKAETSRAISVFCYPYGGLTDILPVSDALLHGEGMTSAVTTLPGYVSQNTLLDTPFRVPRFSWADDLSAVRQVVSGVEWAKELLLTRRYGNFSPEHR